MEIRTHTSLPMKIPFCTLPAARIPPTVHIRISSPASLLRTHGCVLLCKSPGPHIPSLTSAHTWLSSWPGSFQTGGGKPPAVPEPLLVETQMPINNELAFALVLAFGFLYCRASAYVGAKTRCPVYKRASLCPAAQERSVLYRYNCEVSAGVFRSGMPIQGEGGEEESLHLPPCSV